MADPYDRRRRRLFTDGFPDSGSHPFLTEKGLWLQQNGRTEDAAPLPLPEYPPDVEDDAPDSETETPSPKRDTRLGNIADDLDRTALQNVRAAKKYPDPDLFRTKPLSSLFRSRIAESPRSDQRRAVGKLMIRSFDDQRGQFATGSAWLSGPNTLVTSAHNLYDSNTRLWSRSVEFYPAYDFYAGASNPVARVVSCVLPGGYLVNPTTNHDIAICRLDRNLGDELGADIPLREIPGIEFFDNHRVSIFGYPAGSSFDFGKQMWQSTGEFLFGNSNGGSDDHAPAIATDFGGGASGCPWLYLDPATDRYVAVGVTSGHARLRYEPTEPNLMALTSPLLNHRTLERLDANGFQHTFA